MRFLRLRLTNYRGVPASDVAFAETGVTVVEGPNEIGKSSLVEAVRLLFDYKDSSQAAAVRAIQPVGEDVGTTIELTLRAGTFELVYAKTFNRDRRTTLRVLAPAKRSLTGRRAHEYVRSLLAQTVDEALWRALRSEQGAGLAPATGLADAPSLASALDRAAGTVESRVGGEAEETLFDAARREFERYFTPTGRERKPLIASETDVRRSRDRADDARARLEDLEAETLRLERVEAELRAGRAALPDDERALVDAIARTEAVATERRALEELRLRWKNAKLEADGALDRLAAREGLRDDVRRRRTEIDGLASQRAGDEPDWEELEQALATAESSRAQAKDAVENARRVEAAAVAVRRRLELDDEIARAAARHEKITSAIAAAAEAERDLWHGGVDPIVVAGLRESEQVISILRERLDASRPEVRIEALGEIAPTIGAVETPLVAGDKRSIRVARELRIHLPGVAELLVRAAEGEAQLAARIANAERARDEVLAEIGVETVDEAESRLAAFERASKIVRERDRTLATWLEEPDVATLEADLAEKRAGRAALDEVPIDDVLVDPPTTLAAARGVEANARRRRTEAERALDEASTALEAERKREWAMLRAREQIDAKLAAHRDSVGARERELAAARSDADDDEVARLADDAVARRREREAELAEAERRAGDDVYDAARAAEDAARARLETRREEIAGLEAARIEGRTRLAERGDQGWREQLDDAQTALHRALSKRDRLRVRAAAARRLYRTLERERDRARASYAGPLQARIEALGRPLWGEGLSVEIDDRLEVVARTIGDRTLPFESLSGGAKEQLVLLTRLAAAQIVADADAGVPLLLDDALGATDPSRLAAIGEAIAAASARGQVIVLTCDPRRFEAVSGATFVSL